MRYIVIKDEVEIASYDRITFAINIATNGLIQSNQRWNEFFKDKSFKIIDSKTGNLAWSTKAHLL